MCQFRELPRQGSPTWPLWLLSLGGMWARSKEAGAAPLYLILVGQPNT